MKLSVEIILIIIIGIIILFNACSENEHFADVAGTTIAAADIDSIRNLNSIAKTLMQPDGTLTNPGNLNVAGKTTSKGIQSNGVVSDWITGSFGGSPYKGDRVVLGTHAGGAVVGSHNNALNEWAPITVQGSTVNIVSQNPVRIHKNEWANGDLQVAGKLSIAGFGDVANTLGRISAVQVFDLNGPNNTADYIRASNLSAQFTLPSGTKILIVNWQGYYNNNLANTRFYIINQANDATPWSFTFNGNGNNVHVGQSIIKVIPDATLPTGNYKLKVDTDMGLDRDYLNAAIITLP